MECGEMEKIRPLSDAEVSIWVCRFQGAIYENNKEKIKSLQEELKKRIQELKDNGLWKN